MTSDNENQIVNSRAPGIEMHSLFTERIDYRLDINDGESPNCFPIDVEIIIETKEEPPFGFVRLMISCEHPEDCPVGHRFYARMVAVYEKVDDQPSIPFEKFLTYNAPAAMFAFARELVYSVTSRSAIQPILLDPANMFRLMKSGRVKYRQNASSNIGSTSETQN